MLLNQPRAVGLMKEYGVDAIVASTPENVTYLTDFAGWTVRVYKGNTTAKGLQSYAILTQAKGEKSSLILPLMETTYISQFPVWTDDIYPYGTHILDRRLNLEIKLPEEKRLQGFLDNAAKLSPGPGQALVRALKERNLTKGVIGLDVENINPLVLQLLKSEFPGVQFKDACDLFRLIRMVKTQEEIQRLRQVSRINENCREELMDNIREGVTERELRQMFRVGTANQGALMEFFNCPSGVRGGSFFPPSDYQLKKGDMFFVDYGCIYNFYHGDGGACGVLGEPTSEQKRYYDAIKTAIDETVALTKAGTRVSQICSNIDGIAARRGLLVPLMTYGHGVGLEARDLPIISMADVVSPVIELPDSINVKMKDMALETDTVVNIEVPYCIFGFGAVQCEYTLLIKDNGCESIIPMRRELQILG